MAIDPRNIEMPDPAMLAVTRKMSGATKLRLAADMHQSARSMTMLRLQETHPEWTPEQIAEETFRRMNRRATE